MLRTHKNQIKSNLGSAALEAEDRQSHMDCLDTHRPVLQHTAQAGNRYCLTWHHAVRWEGVTQGPASHMASMQQEPQ